ncbi:MAG TPA: relaxase/mobilization nuclease domain-containing protein [Daejeonella sp.]
MVAKIISGKSLIGALNYNEKKVAQGKAQLISENGYAKDIDKMNFYDKLLRLTDLAERNARVVTNTVHISLNFDPGERIDADRLTSISKDYMQRIGFGDQPFLVYQHNDAGHPHIHIVTTNIMPSGERISLHNLGRTKSEEARQVIEKEHGLVEAKSKSRNLRPEREQLQKAEYGKIDTKRAITNIVNEVIRGYRFTSLPELNAVLNQYNVAADQGAKESRMFQRNGLMYWITDDRGRKLGVPIKASSIYGNPTMKKLDERFQLNQTLRKPMREQLKVRIDSVIASAPTMKQFSIDLRREGVQVVFRENDGGRLYGITFVDHRTKCVFNGSDLGKGYSAVALSGKFRQTNQTETAQRFEAPRPIGTPSSYEPDGTDGTGIIDDMLKTEYSGSDGLAAYKRRKKRKRFNL